MFVSLFMTLELLSFLPLINMQLTELQVDLLVGSNRLKDLPNYIDVFRCSASPYSRRNYDIECSEFFRIAQKELLVLVGVGLLLPLVKLVESCLASAAGVFLKVLPLTRRLLLSVLVDLLIKATYSAQATGLDSALSVISWVIIVIVWLLFVALGVLSCRLVFSEASSYPYLKHFFFDNLKPTVFSHLYFSLLILHRAIFAVTTVAFDSASTQLIVITSTSCIVLPRQFAVYLIVQRPFSNIKEALPHIGSFVIISVFCLVLTLFEVGDLGDDPELITNAFLYSLMSTIALHILSMLLGVFLTGMTICLEKDGVVANLE
jgi:hypothetical protein